MLSTIGAFLMWAVKTIDSFLPCPHRPSAPQDGDGWFGHGHAWWMQVWIQIMVDVYINFRFSYMNQRLKFLWDGATSNFMETSSIAAPWRHHSLPLDHRRPASIGGTDT
uniref:Uncharacterized protein n=1 Tax=Oryza glumipatula TaxID=40148 RepID=A0A0D9ZZD2_9ORYZ